MKINNNTILITGGSSGIGLAMARAFAGENNKIIVCATDAEKLHAAQNEIAGLEIKQCDLTVRGEREKLTAWTLQNFPAVNVLINNAGVMRQISFFDEDFDYDSVEQEIAVDLLAPVELTLRFLPHLRRQPVAAIVNISTGLVFSPDAGSPIYSAAKAGINTFTKTLRYQLRDTAVKVFEVFPPSVATDLTPNQPADSTSPETVAEAVLKGFAKDDEDILIGQAKLLSYAAWLAPEFTTRMLNQQIEKQRAQ